jgi:8-oxo-dGTP diphosphatase
MIVNFHELDNSVNLKFSVIVARDNNGFVFVKHQDRDSWEIPGGHIEAGETSAEAAKRELIEETGASSFSVYEVCNYSITVGNSISYGRLFFAEISDYSGSLDFEIDQVKSFAHIPDNLTYPKIQPLIFEEVLRRVLD